MKNGRGHTSGSSWITTSFLVEKKQGRKEGRKEGKLLYTQGRTNTKVVSWRGQAWSRLDMGLVLELHRGPQEAGGGRIRCQISDSAVSAWEK